MMLRRVLSRPLRLAAVLAALVLAGCYPDDPEDTTEQVRGARLVLGWVAGVPQADAPEMAIARRFAEQLSAEFAVVEAPVHDLVEALERGDIHLLAGDLPETSPLSRLYGMSRPVANTRYRDQITARVMAVRQGENGFLVRLNSLIAERP